MVKLPTARPEATPPTPLPGRHPLGPTGPSGAPTSLAALALPLLTVGAVIGWWAWERGAYFGVIFFPGAIVLLGLLAALLLFAPWPAALRGPVTVALTALFALAGWTLLSALWSPAPDIAIEDAQRVLLYGVAFALGLWLCLMLGERRRLFSLAPVAVSMGLVAIATLAALWTSTDTVALFEPDATLQYPLGYRNAAAAFFIGTVFPLLVLAAGRELDWRLRGALLGVATLCLELAVLAQSRGSVFAVVLAVAVLVAAHPARLRILAWLALAALPAVATLPWLLDVFQHGGGNTSESLEPLRSACVAMAISSATSVAIGSAIARLDPSIVLSTRTGRAIGWILAGLLAVAGVIGVVAIANVEGGPAGLVDRHLDELTAGSPDLTEQGSRFGLDLRTERGDIWRVALDDLSENPVAGDGAGGFGASYLRNREGDLQTKDPHSVELLMASELGVPGLLLFGAFAVGAVMAALRARKVGSSAAALAAGSLSFGAYWLGHASVEWFWVYPALTVPVMFALGAAAAPALLRPAGKIAAARRGLAVLPVVLALALVPFLFSERYTNRAVDTWRTDPAGAYADLRRAADLNPFSQRPHLIEAAIAERAGDPQRALAALSSAQERQPEDWTVYYLEARILAPSDPAGAARALDKARELNPRNPEIGVLRKTFEKP